MASRAARSAEIDYRRLARGEITATGTLDEELAGLLQKLEKDGKVEFEIDVELADASGAVVATMTVNWHVRRNT